MGCKKASTVPSDQGNENCIPGCELSSNGDVVGRNNKVSENNKPCEVLSTNSHAKGTAASRSFLSKRGESGSIWSETDKPGNVAKEVHETRPSVRSKRRNSTLGLKNKRLRIENEDSLELKVTWEQVQGLIRPPPGKEPSVFIIEGCELEEYEDAPVIGRPTIPAEDHLGRKIQWVQCEDCFKWRKLPANALLPSRWTCSKNSWDPDRAVCSAVEELTTEKLETLLPSMATATSKKMKASKLDPDSVAALEGLDALAHLAVQEKAGSLPASSQSTTKHPRHKVGCSCIVCIQPPSGKGPKHKQPCDCVVCKSVKRRHKTLMMKREKKQSEKEAEPSQELQPQPLAEQVLNIDGGNRSPKEEMRSDEGFVDNADDKCCASTFKGQIDLNIQPEREEDHLASFYQGTTAARPLLDDRERHHKQQRLSSLGGGDLARNQTHQDGVGCAKVGNGVLVDDSCKRGADISPDKPSSLKEVLLSSSPTDPHKQ